MELLVDWQPQYGNVEAMLVQATPVCKVYNEQFTTFQQYGVTDT